MGQRLSIWRAAQLLGVARGVLQQQVRDGVLEADDGMVTTQELLRVYPQAPLEDNGVLERVVQLRDDAFARRVRERTLPNQEVLAQRLFAQSQELADVRKHLQRYHQLLMALRETVRRQCQQSPGDAAWAALEEAVRQGLAEVLATEPVNVLEVMNDMLKVMTAQVTLRPSGHQFLVEGHANLLQSGLQAGLKLNYGCGNGTCGMCKVRVIAGEVVRTQASDYPMSQAEREQGYTLMCCTTAASPEVTLELLEAGGPQDIPEQTLVAQVRAVTTLGPDTRLLHLQTPRSHRLRFLAGQSVSLGLDVPGVGAVQATYAIGSCPCDDRNLLFYLGRDEADALASQVFAGRCTAGSAVSVRGPWGEFVLAESPRPLVFVACDLGIAPIKSLIEHALSLDTAPKIALFWLATRADGHFLENHCRAWSEALDPFEYELVTHPDPAAGGRLTASAMCADLFCVDCDFYLCGPSAFVDAVTAELHVAGVPQGQMQVQVL